MISFVGSNPLSAQLVRGVVRGADSGAPIADAEVQIYETNREGSAWTMRTDLEGRFAHAAPGSGRYAIWVRLIGYRPNLTIVQVAPSDTVAVAIQLEPFVVVVKGVTVYGMSVRTSGQAEFWSRRDKPWIQSVDYKQIERLRPSDLKTLVERLLPFKTRCGTKYLIYVDGSKQDFIRELNDTPLDWVYGVEVFRDYYDIPTRYRDPTDPRSKCGAVLVWTSVIGQIER